MHGAGLTGGDTRRERLGRGPASPNALWERGLRTLLLLSYCVPGSVSYCVPGSVSLHPVRLSIYLQPPPKASLEDRTPGGATGLPTPGLPIFKHSG